MGYDHLEIYLRTRTSYDYYEISKILGESMGDIDALLIFDDFHKSNDKIRDFFVYFLKMLTSSSKTKMIILSREMVPFYDRRDVRIRKTVSELELEGLDFESSKKILREKGIDKKRFKEIYKFTTGNPLFLELFESGDDLERYMHDELLSKLGKDERKILGILSIYRYPIQNDALFVFDDFDFEKLYNLTQKSIVKKDAYYRYFIHDIIRSFMYITLSPSIKRKYHLLTARWYENKEEPMELIEAIYHYQEAGRYKKASRVAIDCSKSILDAGYASEFLFTLESFDDKNLDSNFWIEILILKGKAYDTVGQWKKALLCFNESSDIGAIIGNKTVKAMSICESGHILEEQNQFDEAMKCFKKCLDISKKADHSLGIGSGYCGMGRVHWRRSEHEQAISSFEKCIEISKKSGDLDLTASANIDLGNVYDEMWETEKAIECYHKSLDILNKVRNKYETARAYGNLGTAYKNIEDFDNAIKYTTRELMLAQDIGEIKLVGYSLAGLSYCLAKIGEFEKAKKHAK
jgi:tetratricopeptide (TPR) repeat protein